MTAGTPEVVRSSVPSVTLPGRTPTTLAGAPEDGRRCRDLLGPTGVATATVGGRVAWALWGLTLLSLPVGIWLSQLLRRAGLAELSSLQAADLLWILAGVTAATVGAVLASRRPAHPAGWLLLVVGLSEQFTNLVGDYVHYGVMGPVGYRPPATCPGSTTAAPW
jgi:hypothetical protein